MSVAGLMLVTLAATLSRSADDSAIKLATDVGKLIASPNGISGGGGNTSGGEGVELALDEPETLSDVLASALDRGHGWRFLKDVDWRLKTFQDDDGQTSLGAAFGYKKSAPTKLWDHDDGRGVSGLGVEFDASGNMAFENDLNPADFISARLTVDYFRSRGGTRGPLEPEKQLRVNELSMKASEYDDREKLLGSEEWRELKQISHEVLTTQVYWEFGLDTSFETDQDFDAKNYTLGAHAALDVRAWNEKSELATLNLFDYPAAFARYLTGFDEEFQPRGSSIPTLVLGLDYVEPDGNTPRSDVGDDSSYQRVRMELAYKAPLAILEGKHYYLTAVYRGYIELDPSDAVESAGLDDSNYLTLAFETEDGLFASYSTGRLPFDDDNAEVFSLGWRFQM